MFKYSHVFATLQWTMCVRGKKMCTYLCMCALIITQSKKIQLKQVQFLVSALFQFKIAIYFRHFSYQIRMGCLQTKWKT